MLKEGVYFIFEVAWSLLVELVFVVFLLFFVGGGSVVVSIEACGASGLGSNPSRCLFLTKKEFFLGGRVVSGF